VTTRVGGTDTVQTFSLRDRALNVLLSVDASDTCLSYERIDVRGERVADGTHCMPEKCARLSRSVTEPWMSCGGAFALPKAAWDLVAPNRCSDPLPTFTDDGGDRNYAVAPGQPEPPPRDDAGLPARLRDDGGLLDAGFAEGGAAEASFAESAAGLAPGSTMHASSSNAGMSSEEDLLDDEADSVGCALAPAAHAQKLGFVWLALLALWLRRRAPRSGSGSRSPAP
jgi:hypothetical protein